MGCLSSQESQNSNDIERKLRKMNDESQNKRKLLLLGTGESGKSTLFKQMKIIHQGGFTREEAHGYRRIVLLNLLESLQDCIKGMAQIGIQWKVGDNSRRSVELMKVDVMAPQTYDQVLTKIPDIQALLADPAFDEAQKRTYEYFHLDSAFYWFSNKDRILNNFENYLPTADDILRTRVTTTGVIISSFHQSNTTFEMYDVGGQRGERKKWLHCFDNVDAVLFVASLTEYDQVLREDPNTNRLKEALDLWAGLLKYHYFRETTFILFLNKDDIFRQKIEVSDPHNHFPDYNGGCNYDLALDYIQSNFERLAGDAKKDVTTHVTTATNTDNFTVIWDSVRRSIVMKHIISSGLASQDDGLM